MGVINPIVRGYCWSQQFIAPDGTLQSSDQLRVEMRLDRQSSAIFALTEGNGVSFSGQTIQVDLTEVQTAMISNLRPLMFDFRIIRSGCDVYLSPVVTVPVVEPVTKGYSA